mgnify:CR=1 FL=1
MSKSKVKKINFTKIKSYLTNSNNRILISASVILFSVYLIIAFISFFSEWKTDDSIVAGKSILDVIKDNNINNQIGGFGAYISNLLIKQGFGITTFIIPMLFFLFGIKIMGFSRIRLLPILKHSLIILLVVPVSIFHFFKKPIISGKIGIGLNEVLSIGLGKIGTTLLILTIILLYVIISLNIRFHKIRSIVDKLKLKKQNVEEITINHNVNYDAHDEKINEKEDIKNQNTNPKLNNDSKQININSHENIEVDINKQNDETILSESEIQKKLKEIGDFDPTLELSKYEMPTISLLNNYGKNKIEVDQSELENNKNRIVETLGNYKIGISSVTATVGPTITLYEIVPEAGIRISKIKNLEDDIALSLAAEGIRIIAPIPGKGTIGIEVPNKNKNTVSMLEVLQSEKFQNNNMELPIAFGKNISNETHVVDLTKMPHLLMAGATGQGKSVGLNVILTSLLYKKHPAKIKFVLVDPKKVELTLFNKIERHYLAKLPDNEDAIITDTKKVVNTVKSLGIEMDERYELCKKAHCRNIIEYNKKFVERKLNPNMGHRYLPYIVLVIDEFADLIMTAGKEIETPIARLAQLARAIGIHLIIATQRPSVNVITGLIKANFPARVAFRVTSSTDSRTILDSKGAEQLIGMGDMLISTGSDLTRLQCAFIDTPEVEKICDYIGSQQAFPQAHLLPEYTHEESNNSTNSETLDERDQLFEEAARIVIQHQSGSTSLIQRKLKLGYNRAGRIIDQLESVGIVGPFEGSKARKVLIKDGMSLEEILKKLNDE